jgi:type I restriction enzyme S subunit
MELKKLKKVVDVITGYPFEGELYSEEGIRVVRGENITEGRLRWDTIKCWNLPFDKKEFYSLKENDVVIGMDGSKVGKNKARIKKEDLPLILAQRVACLRAKETLNQVFLYYCIHNNRFEEFVFRIQTGSSVPHISKTQIEEFTIPYHDISTQKAIAKVLSDLDAKIELNNRINRELEAMAKTLYDYWFVQFDFPNEQGRPYKSSGGKMVYNAELKREIPEGWENGTLGDISDLVRGVTYDASDIKEENDYDVIPILRATNISGNVIDLDNMVFVPKQNVSANQVLNKFDILITMSSGSKDHIGKNGFFYFDKEVAFGAFCAKIVAKDKYRFYVYSYTQSDFMFSTIKNECLGTNINNLNGSLVKGFKIVIPPVDLVEKFNNEVLSIYEMIGNNHKQNQQLSELRDWLLPMLMNGQVMVKEAEERLRMAAEPSVEYKKG